MMRRVTVCQVWNQYREAVGMRRDQCNDDVERLRRVHVSVVKDGVLWVW